MSASNQLAQVEELAQELAARRAVEAGAPDAVPAAAPDETPDAAADEKPPAGGDAASVPGAASAKQRRPLTEDEKWARRNLRWQNGRPIADIANALRVFERHGDFKGRFKFNEMVNRVLDKGTVMVDWRIFELCAIIQERFMPGVDEPTVLKALTVAANKTGVSK